jgi:hypothetical protein
MDSTTKKLTRTVCLEALATAAERAKQQELDPSFLALAIAYPDGEVVTVAVSHSMGTRDLEMGEEITSVFETACEMARRKIDDRRRRRRSRPEVKPS